ncbi:nuclear transport factor 2 family protein [Bradyrhizobium sp. HKCCYLS1011]|uniref:nuclear transport factor 2 family protein n=1 Tax=Bradyrhizobium sp. HKCCYLS1011 TaxID=3420733 RepID=UPI003EBFA3FA
MRCSLISMAGAIVAALSTPAMAQRAYAPEEERNKAVVLDFYEQGLNRKDFAAASKYLGTYIQHNPNAEDGPEGFRKFIEFLKAKYPQSHSEITKVLVDGDFVILRVHAIREPGTRGNAIVDIFRLKDGKIEEHWDSVQPIPEQSANQNGMF